MKHTIIATMLFLTLTPCISASESPSSFTSPKDSRKKDRMASQPDAQKLKLSSSDKDRLKGGERQRLKQQAKHLTERADLITKQDAPELE